MIEETLRLAAIGDIHCTRKSDGAFRALFNRVSQEADVFLMCGDLTDYGLPEEAHILANEIKIGLEIPAVAVLGNHDYESGKQNEVKNILLEAGVTVLDGDACEIRGIGFAGVKGFCGGFGERSVEAWGEEALKHFVHATVDETLKLEAALARVHTDQKVVLLHYAPIPQTVVGEPLEIYAFLGSRRLEDPVNRFHCTMVFHGHAHYGSPEGLTASGIPVYNVAMPLMKKLSGMPFRVINLPVKRRSELLL